MTCSSGVNESPVWVRHQIKQQLKDAGTRRPKAMQELQAVGRHTVLAAETVAQVRRRRDDLGLS